LSEDQASANKKPARGFYILVCVLGANVLMMFGLIWLAEVNRPELVELHYYTAGSIDSVKKQSQSNRESGWVPKVEVITENGQLMLRVFVYDTTKQVIPGLHVTAGAYRPSSALLDRPEKTLTPDSLGYKLEMQPPLQKGLWNILLTIKSVENNYFRGRYPIFIE